MEENNILKEKVRDFWDKSACGEIYAKGETDKEKYEIHGKIRYELEPYIPVFANFNEGSGKDVLEIGVGMGEFAGFCKSRQIDYAGIEPNKTLRESLARKGFSVVEGKAPDLPKLEKSFDCVFAAHLIEHLKDYEEIAQLIHRAVSLLNPGGVIILIYPDIEKSGWVFYQDYTHLYPTTRKRVENILTDSDMRIVRSGYHIGPFVQPVIVSLLHFIVKCFPFFLMPKRIEDSLRGRLQTCGFTIAAPLNS